MILVPDLATDLGTPNDDFTEWTFTIRDGVKWENGDPVTAEDVAFGIVPLLGRARRSRTARLTTATRTSWAATSTRVPTPRRAPTASSRTRLGRRQHDHHQDGQAVPGHAVLGVVPGHGPDPAGRGLATRPSTPCTRGRPARTSSRSTASEKSLTLEQNDQWDPAHRPGSHAVPGRVRLQGRPAARPDRPDHAGRLGRGPDHADATTTSRRRTTASSRTSTRTAWSLGGSPCTYFYALGLPQDHRQGGPRGARLGATRTRTVLAAGPDPRRQRDPGHRT